jgi:two-component system, response regulator YesN
MFKVLLVDDEPFVTKALKVLIDWEELGYSICGEASHGEEAVEIIKELKPDVVITDIRMPRMDGLELIRYCSEVLKANSEFIVLSGYNDFKYAQQAIKYRVKEYLLKPIDEEELVDRLKELSKEFLKKKESLEESYKKAKLNMTYNFYRNSGCLLLQEDITKLSFNYSFEKILSIRYIIEAIDKGEKSNIESIVKEVFSQFYKSLSTVEAIKMYLNSLIVELMKLINEVGGEVDCFMQEYSSFVSRIEDLNFEETKKSTLKLCIECISYIKSLKDNSSRGVINEVEKYIKKHYMEEINLKLISEKFYMNPVYLGQQFKKYFGKHFNDYINEMRIEEAKKLLTRTNKKIYEISEAVGYKNRDYFVGRFQKSTNMTPTEYKRSLQSLSV